MLVNHFNDLDKDPVRGKIRETIETYVGRGCSRKDIRIHVRKTEFDFRYYVSVPDQYTTDGETWGPSLLSGFIKSRIIPMDPPSSSPLERAEVANRMQELARQQIQQHEDERFMQLVSSVSSSIPNPCDETAPLALSDMTANVYRGSAYHQMTFLTLENAQQRLFNEEDE